MYEFVNSFGYKKKFFRSPSKSDLCRYKFPIFCLFIEYKSIFAVFSKL